MPDKQTNNAQIYKKLKRYFLEREIANFYEYLNTLDEVLTSREQEISENLNLINDDLIKISQNDVRRGELINLKVEATQVKGFSNLLRQSFLVSLYSFMELWLVRDCHLDSKKRDNGQSYKSVKGTGIVKVKSCFSRVMQSNFDFDSQDWQWVTNFRLLRNCIIHRQGSLTGHSDFEVNSTLAGFVNREEGLSLFGVNNQQIFVEREFCLNALQTVHKFMLEILSLTD